MTWAWNSLHTDFKLGVLPLLQNAQDALTPPQLGPASDNPLQTLQGGQSRER